MAGWLSAVAGTAEGLLNKLDQSAAEALSTNDEPQPFNLNGSKLADKTTFDSVQSATSSPFLSSSQSVPSRLHELRTSTDPSSSLISSPIKQSTPKAKIGSSEKPKLASSDKLKLSSSEKPKQASSEKTKPSSSDKPVGISKSKEELKKKDSDEALFEFLNSKDPIDNNKRKYTPSSSRQHSRQSSSSSVGRVLKPVEVTSAVSVTTTSDSRQESPTGSHESPDIDVLADALHESPALSVHSSQGSDINNHRESDQQISSLELENRLLRNEVASLNTEMATQLERSKETQKELENTRKQMNKHNTTVSQNDQIVRELRARESDLTEALAAKDSQLAILRVRLEEGDNSISSLKKQTEHLQSQRERILQDHTDSSGMHSQALDSLKDKLVEVEATLKREQDGYQRAQQEAYDRQSKLEQEQQTLAESLTQSDRKISEEKNKAVEANNQLKMMKLNLESSRQELTDYKDKASRILQSKERLISSLREGGGNTFGESSGISSIEFDSIKQERDMLKEELQQSKMLIENYKVELQDLESQLQQEGDTAADQIRSLDDNLNEEKRRREDAEQELLKQKQELQYAIDEINKQKTSFQSQISSREAEIDKLRNQLMTKSFSSVTENELESRVRALTESLIQKQTMLESLSTEKNSYALQLERLEQQYRDVQISSARSAPTSVNMNDDDEVRQRVPIFMKEAANDTEVTRRMKRAANGIDRFSIRLGVFLRRYPIARIFVILYMGLLHVWVMIVLLTYQPEIHASSHGQPKSPDDP